MLNGYRAYNTAGRLTGLSGRTRRSCWQARTSLRDDSLAGPGPSSIAAAAARNASVTAATSIYYREISVPRAKATATAGVFGAASLTSRRVRGSLARTAIPLPSPATSEAAAQETSASRYVGGKSRRKHRRKSRSKEMYVDHATARPKASPDMVGPGLKQEPQGSTAARGSGSSTGGGGSDYVRKFAAAQSPSTCDAATEPSLPTTTVVAAAAEAGAINSQRESRGNLSRPKKSILDIASNSGNNGFRLRSNNGTRPNISTVEGNSNTAPVVEGSEGEEAGSGAPFFPIRLPDGRQLVKVVNDTPSAAAASALSHALGMEQRAVVRFDGGTGSLKGLRTLTLANMFMGGYQRALSFVVDVKQVPQGKPSPLEERPQSGDVSFMYRIMTRARSLEPYDKQLPAAIRQTRFLLDLSINVRQAWDMKGDVDEEQAYDLADTLYGALLARQAEEDFELQERHNVSMNVNPEMRHDLDLDLELDHTDLGNLTHGHPVEQELKGLLGRGTRPRQQQQQRWQQQDKEERVKEGVAVPWIIVTADLGQGPTMLTALGLLQKRLREERQNAIVETTLYRASVAAPRLNAKDGWVYVIGLGFEAPYLPVHANRRVPQSQERRPQCSSASVSKGPQSASAKEWGRRDRGGGIPAIRSAPAAAVAQSVAVAGAY